jgi:hypothetical protein
VEWRTLRAFGQLANCGGNTRGASPLTIAPVVPARMARLAGLIGLTAIAFFRFETRLMEIPFTDRRPLVRYFAHMADRGWEQYIDFLVGVRAHTAKGDSIAIMVPARHWDDGYSYAYYRASYMLAGRQVIPLVSPDDRVVFGNLSQATYLAEWRHDLPVEQRVVWSGAGGKLVRRR